MYTHTDAPLCGHAEHLVFSGKLKGTDDFLCVCLVPGQHYSFRLGAAGEPLKVSFSVDETQVVGEYDWEEIDDVDWTFLSVTNKDTTYTIWVSRPETENALPSGRLEVNGDNTTPTQFEPATIIHDLPFA